MARNYSRRRLGHSLVKNTIRGIRALGRKAAAFPRAAWGILTRSYTLVLVPHSDKNVYRLHVSVLSACLCLLVIIGVVGGAFWYGLSWNGAAETIADRDSRLNDAQASLDQLRDEVAHLLNEMKIFEPAMTSTLSALGTDVKSVSTGTAVSSGDLSAFFDTRGEVSSGIVQEVEDVRRVSEYLAAVAEPVKEVGMFLGAQGTLFSEIPSIWPIQRSKAHISQTFGQNSHPFTGLPYIHTGIDLSTYQSGDPIVVTADGEVAAVYFDNTGFGLTVTVRHKHSFYTRYAHMSSTPVRIGQSVKQGDVIGFIGNTGQSTGPHLHYQIHLGSDVVDPHQFLNFKPAAAAKSR